MQLKRSPLTNGAQHHGQPRPVLSADERARAIPRVTVFGVPFTPIGPEETLDILFARNSGAPFAYVVTPNAQHVVLANEDQDVFLGIVQNAMLCVCDSRIVRRLAKLNGVELPINAGSDLTELLFKRNFAAEDPVTIIGGSDEMVAFLKAKYELKKVNHYNPPMYFIQSEREIETCVRYVREHPGRFVLLAVGAPQQELLAERLHFAAGITGVGLCIGGSLNFLAGIKPRAPLYVRQMGMEWLYRLMKEPTRIGPRVVQSLPILGLAARAFTGRMMSGTRRSAGS